MTSVQVNAGSFPLNNGLNLAGSGRINQVAVRVYVHEGQRYCFYFNGWHGPGWYRCGFANRRGLGWGGVYGWNDWSYGPYERRFGRVHQGQRFDVDRGSHRMGGSIDTETRTRSTSGIDKRNRTRSTTGIETRSRSTTGSGVEGGAPMRGGATGKRPAPDVQSGGGAKIQGGPGGEGSSVRGCGGMEGSGPAGEGGSKRQ